MLDLRPDQLITAVGFELVEDIHPGVRFTVYEMPRPGRVYTLGCDFALGQAGRDLDTGCVLDATEAPSVQVAEYGGSLGEWSDKMAYAVAMFYGGAFIVGERQFGLPSLRRLLRDYKYGWLYYERDETKRNRAITDKLGYFKRGNWVTDPLLRNFRAAVREGDIEIRSRTTWDQMRRLVYRPRSRTIDPETATDADLSVQLTGGGSPDYVMAAAYAYLGVRELVNFPRIEPKYAPGTYGELMGLNELAATPGILPGKSPRRANQVANISTSRRRR